MSKLTTIVIVLWSIGCMSSVTKTVKKSGGDYSTIQSCVSALSAGDTCEVWPTAHATATRYEEFITDNTGVNLTVQSGEGCTPAAVDSNNYPVIPTCTVSIEGVTFSNLNANIDGFEIVAGSLGTNTTTTGTGTSSTSLTVTDTTGFVVGAWVAIGLGTTVTHITAVPDGSHLTVSPAVSWTAGQYVSGTLPSSGPCINVGSGVTSTITNNYSHSCSSGLVNTTQNITYGGNSVVAGSAGIIRGNTVMWAAAIPPTTYSGPCDPTKTNCGAAARGIEFNANNLLVEKNVIAHTSSCFEPHGSNDVVRANYCGPQFGSQSTSFGYADFPSATQALHSDFLGATCVVGLSQPLINLLVEGNVATDLFGTSIEGGTATTVAAGDAGTGTTLLVVDGTKLKTSGLTPAFIAFGPIPTSSVAKVVSIVGNTVTLEAVSTSDPLITRTIGQNIELVAFNSKFAIWQDPVAAPCGSNHVILRFNTATRLSSYWTIPGGSPTYQFYRIMDYNNTGGPLLLGVNPPNGNTTYVGWLGKDFGVGATPRYSISGYQRNDLWYNTVRRANTQWYSVTNASLTSDHNFAYQQPSLYCTGGVGGKCSFTAPISTETGTIINNTSNLDSVRNPNFVTAPSLTLDTAYDYHLQASSAALTVGAPLATVAAGDSGTGTTLVVDNADWFQFGQGGIVNADRVAVKTTTNVATVSSITASANIYTPTTTLTLATDPGARSVGDPVYLYSDSQGNVVLPSNGPYMGALGQNTSPPFNLTVTVNGTATGYSTGDDGLDCGTTVGHTACTEPHSAGNVINLTAHTSTGSFIGWGNLASSCGTSTTCAVTMPAADANVSATFSLVPAVTIVTDIPYCNVVQKSCTPTLTVTGANLGAVGSSLTVVDASGVPIVDASTGLSAVCSYGVVNAFCGDGTMAGPWTIHTTIANWNTSLAQETATVNASAGGLPATATVSVGLTGRTANTPPTVTH